MRVKSSRTEDSVVNDGSRWHTCILILFISFLVIACGNDSADPEAATTETPSDTGVVEIPSPESLGTPSSEDADLLVPRSAVQVDGMVCCADHGQVDGRRHLFVMTVGGGEQSNHGVLHILEITDGGSLTMTGKIETPVALSLESLTSASRIAFANGVVFMPVPGQATSGLWVVDVSEPASPQEAAFVETEYPPISVTVSDNLLAVAVQEFNGPALFFDVSDPTSPQIVGEHEYSASMMPPTIEFVDSLFYVLDSDSVDILDVASRDVPYSVGEYENPEWMGEPNTGGSVADSMLDRIAKPEAFLDIAGSDQYVYIASSDSGLRVVDIADPANPRQVAHVRLPDRALRVYASENWTIVITVSLPEGRPPFAYTMHVIDIADSSDPSLVRSSEAFEAMAAPPVMVVENESFFLLDFSTVQVFDLTIE